MGRTPRRQRARLKAWIYLALFGASGDEDDADRDDADDTEDDASDMDADTPEE